MVNIGNLVIDDLSLFAFLIIILGFSYWYYNRVLKALGVSVAEESKAGDYRVYKGEWNQNENTVTIIRGRKDKQILEKKYEPKLFHYSSTHRVLMFRAVEGSLETQPWANKRIVSSNAGLGYKAASLIEYYKNRAQSQSTNSLRGQMMGIMIGLGFGLVFGIMFSTFFPQMFA